MMMKTKTGFLALILCTLMLLNTAGLSGCKKDEEIAPAVSQRVTNVYRSDFLSLPENYNSNGRLSYFDGRLYMLCSEVIDPTNYTTRNILYSVDAKGENPESKPIEFDTENTYINQFLQCPDGGFVLVTSSYDETTQTQSFQLIKETSDGSTVFAVDPQPLFPNSGESNAYGGFYINYVTLDGEGNIYLGNSMGGESTTIVCLSPDGQKLFDIPLEGYLNDMAAGANGRVFVKYNDRTNWEMVIRYVDVQKKALDDKIEIPAIASNSGNAEIYLGNGYDLYIKNNTGLYGVNWSETEPVLLANWLNSDVNPNSVQSLVVINPDQFVYMGWDQISEKQQIAFLTRVPDDEVTPKFLINVACLNPDYNLTAYIVSFNRQSNDYRVVLKDYSTYNTSEDYGAGANILKNEIAAGNVPDIMLLQYFQFPIESYEAKGLFADLYSYLDSDPALSRNDLMDCVMKPFERDGKLYRMTTSFSIQTLTGKTANIGSASSWTLDEMLTFAKNLPEGVSLMENITKSAMLYTLMVVGANEFIDHEAGTCSFDKETFIELLNYLNTLPTEIDYTQYDQNQDRYEVYRENKVMLASNSFYSFSSYLQTNFMFDFEPVNFIGYPTTGTSGALIGADSSYAISSKSPVKDGAWEFIKYCVLALNESSSTRNMSFHGFPATKTAFENFAKQEMGMVYNFSNDGSWGSGSFNPDAENVDEIIAQNERQGSVTRFLTQEDVDAVKKYINTLSQSITSNMYDEKIMEILNEEVQPFFEGAKSAEETAKIIQNRVSIYLSEQK